MMGESELRKVEVSCRFQNSFKRTIIFQGLAPTCGPVSLMHAVGEYGVKVPFARALSLCAPKREGVWEDGIKTVALVGALQELGFKNAKSTRDIAEIALAIEASSAVRPVIISIEWAKTPVKQEWDHFAVCLGLAKEDHYRVADSLLMDAVTSDDQLHFYYLVKEKTRYRYFANDMNSEPYEGLVNEVVIVGTRNGD